MNTTVYIFGEFASGYSQYPDDYTNNIFKKCYSLSKAVTQIAIHRDGNLMYYSYLRKLEQNRYVGLCVVINGMMLIKLDGLFSLFENTISNMVSKGMLIHFDDKGNITSRVSKLYLNKEEIDLITTSLESGFERLSTYATSLPPTNYSVGKDSIKEFSIQGNESDIIKAGYTYGYTFIYKSKDFNTAEMYSSFAVINKQKKEIENLTKQVSQLKSDNTSLKNKQRNTLWVSILAIIAIVFGVIIFNKVLFPSVVTNYDAGDYMYYGPMENGKPNGVGVAIYHEQDKDNRLYYYGNFEKGLRKDENAIMFYKDGSYFRGSMEEDNWVKGLFFDVENAHFVGEFKNNQPWNGEWYKHVAEQTIHGGK